MLTEEREKEIRDYWIFEIYTSTAINDLLAEIDRIRKIADRCDSLGHSQFCSETMEENQRLKERIEKLIEAVLWASPCGQNWITPEQHPSYETIGKVMREAIAKDQEAAK